MRGRVAAALSPGGPPEEQDRGLSPDSGPRASGRSLPRPRPLDLPTPGGLGSRQVRPGGLAHLLHGAYRDLRHRLPPIILGDPGRDTRDLASSAPPPPALRLWLGKQLRGARPSRPERARHPSSPLPLPPAPPAPRSRPVGSSNADGLFPVRATPAEARRPRQMRRGAGRRTRWPLSRFRGAPRGEGGPGGAPEGDPHGQGVAGAGVPGCRRA